jgi:hypothetical protein
VLFRRKNQLSRPPQSPNDQKLIALLTTVGECITGLKILATMRSPTKESSLRLTRITKGSI